MEQWCHLYRASEISTYFVIYIGFFFLQYTRIRIRADVILNIRIRGCQNICIRIYIRVHH